MTTMLLTDSSEQIREASLPAACDSRADQSRAEIQLLLIDDEVDEANPVVRLLLGNGFTVTCTGSGIDGLQAAVFAPPDVILLDLHLPDMLGLTILSELRRRGCSSPVIVMTGWYADSGHEEAAAALGAFAFLRKPLDADHLVDTLRAAITVSADPMKSFLPMPCRRRTEASRDRVRGDNMDDDALRALHTRGVAGEALAIDSVVERTEPYLRRSLTAQFHAARLDWIHDAAQDALLEYRAQPGRFEASKGVPLKAFLLSAARRDLLNRLEAERTRILRESVQDPMLGRERTATSPSFDRDLDFKRVLTRVSREMSKAERAVLRQLWRGGSASDLAKAAHVDNLVGPERRLAVKRVVNRILQRLRRTGLRA